MKVKDVNKKIVRIDNLIRELDREDCRDHLNEWYEGMARDIKAELKDYLTLLLELEVKA